MEVKMQVGKILNLNDVIKNIIDNKDLMIETSIKFKLLSILKAFESVVYNFNIIKNEKIHEFGSENENGIVSINMEDKENVKKFEKSLQSVIKDEVTIVVDKIKADDIFNKDIPADCLIALYDLIEE